MLCFGCGEDLMDGRVRHSLQTQHIVPLWSQLFNDDYRSKGVAMPARLTPGIVYRDICTVNTDNHIHN